MSTRKKNLSYNKRIMSFMFLAGTLMTILIVWIGVSCQGKIDESKRILKKIDVTRGICVLLEDKDCKLAIKLAQESDLLIYVQLTKAKDVEIARQVVDEAGFYGSRIFIEKGQLKRIHMADNLADVLITFGEA